MLEATKEQLLPALTAAASAAASRSTMTVLMNVRLHGDGELLTVTGTDLETTTEAYAKVEHCDIDTTVNARKLLDIVKTMPSGAKIKMRMDDSKLIVRSGRSRYSLQTLLSSDFPEPQQLTVEPIQLESQALLKAISEVQYAMAKDDVRYYLNGLLFSFKPEQLTLAATDGHRLSVSEIDIETGVDAEYILPNKSVSELKSALQRSPAVKLAFDPNAMAADYELGKLTTKLVDGKFPDFNRVIPQFHTQTLVVNADGLKSALQRVKVLANEKYRGAKIILAGQTLTIETNNPEQEKATEVIDCQHDADLEIGFNVDYLIDAMSTIETENAIISYMSAGEPVLIQDETKSGMRAVCMPMRV